MRFLERSLVTGVPSQILLGTALLALLTPVVAVLRSPTGVPDPSVTYLLAVIVMAATGGTAAAVITAVTSMLLARDVRASVG